LKSSDFTVDEFIDAEVLIRYLYKMSNDLLPKESNNFMSQMNTEVEGNENEFGEDIVKLESNPYDVYYFAPDSLVRAIFSDEPDEDVINNKSIQKYLLEYDEGIKYLKSHKLKKDKSIENIDNWIYIFNQVIKALKYYQESKDIYQKSIS
jgi:hypothetical protein